MRERSMERSGVRVKTESKTEEKREKYLFLSAHTSCCKTEFKKKKTTVLQTALQQESNRNA